jgi:hypothetical protein
VDGQRVDLLPDSPQGIVANALVNAHLGVGNCPRFS